MNYWANIILILQLVKMGLISFTWVACDSGLASIKFCLILTELIYYILYHFKTKIIKVIKYVMQKKYNICIIFEIYWNFKK